MTTCVVCQSTANVYCENDQAFLCYTCDGKIHSSNPLASRHLRVKVCELCNKAASTVYCKNDKAFLCDDCDSEIHLNNPLAARHEIVPVAKAMQDSDVKRDACTPALSAAQSETSAVPLVPDAKLNASPKVPPAVDLPSSKAVMSKEQMKSYWPKEMELFDMDSSWLDRLDMGFDFSDILGDMGGTDGLVPTLQMSESSADNAAVVPQLPPRQVASDRAPASILPAPAAKADIVPAQATAPAGAPQSAAAAVKPQLVPVTQPATAGAVAAAANSADANFSLPSSTLHVQEPLNREARVARYREKRKLRKFQKTIRYASRKAYAEVRPRIKGRFAKREEMLAWAAAAQEHGHHHCDHDHDLQMSPLGSFESGDLIVPDMLLGM